MPSRSDLTEALRAHLREGRHARHPLPEELVAYHEERLSPDAADEVRTHLVACPDCTSQLLGLADLADGQEDPGPEVSQAERDAAWQRQRTQLFPGPPAGLAGRPARRKAITPLRRAWVTAASLGLAAALLAVVAIAQWQTIAVLRQPSANPPLVNLAPAGSVRQESAEAPRLLLPPTAQRVWVILNPVRELHAAAYDVEVLAPDGRAVLLFKDLQASEAANFRLEIPRGVLTPGDYRVLLFARTAASRQVLEEFDLRVCLVPSPAP